LEECDERLKNEVERMLGKIVLTGDWSDGKTGDTGM
jgi:hypothetical protein